VHSFRRDANDEERIGIHETHLPGTPFSPAGVRQCCHGSEATLIERWWDSGLMLLLYGLD